MSPDVWIWIAICPASVMTLHVPLSSIDMTVAPSPKLHTHISIAQNRTTLEDEQIE
jgi:hypothetical protein